MVNDPYAVLGIQHGATQDEIKRAYRQKAKENHPDLHPDDPKATERMNDINTAYDMLMHPEKYAGRQQQSNPYGQGNPYGSAGQGNPYGQYGPFGYGQQGQQQSSSYGPGGYTTFDFGDLFGFGAPWQAGGQVPPPQEQPGDPEPFRQAVRFVNSRQYQMAVNVLSGVVSASRNARWYYLSALAQNGLGNTMMATEHMQRAVQMDPNNVQYHQLLNQFRRGAQTYQQNAGGFNMNANNLQRLCMSLCIMQMCCGSGCCFPCGFYW